VLNNFGHIKEDLKIFNVFFSSSKSKIELTMEIIGNINHCLAHEI